MCRCCSATVSFYMPLFPPLIIYSFFFPRKLIITKPKNRWKHGTESTCGEWKKYVDGTVFISFLSWWFLFKVLIKSTFAFFNVILSSAFLLPAKGKVYKVKTEYPIYAEFTMLSNSHWNCHWKPIDGFYQSLIFPKLERHEQIVIWVLELT